MSSARKALELLNFFSGGRPEIGLSQFCRLANRDKATTYRHLQALEETNLIEQNPLTKRYRLGPAVLQLAHVREITVPRKSSAEDTLRELANVTGETAHASVLSGTTMYALMSFESPKHSTRVIVDIQTFPLHATASGICALAFGPDHLINAAKADMRTFTANTVSSVADLQAAIQQVKQTGFGRSDGSFEDNVQAIAAPVYDQTGLFAGSVAVASVATRFTPKLEQTIKMHLMSASRQITRNWGGATPAPVERAWQRALPDSYELETTS